MDGAAISGYMVVDKDLKPISPISITYDLAIKQSNKSLEEINDEKCSILLVSGNWAALSYDEADYIVYGR